MKLIFAKPNVKPMAFRSVFGHYTTRPWFIYMPLVSVFMIVEVLSDSFRLHSGNPVSFTPAMRLGSVLLYFNFMDTPMAHNESLKIVMSRVVKNHL